MADIAPSDDAATAAFPLRDSIAARLLRIIFGAYLVVAVLVTCIQLALEYRDTENRVVAEIHAMQNTFGRAISDAMWNYNTEVLRGIVSGIKEIPIVQGLKIEDEKGALVRALGTLQDEHGRRFRATPEGRLSPAEQKDGLFDEVLSRQYPIVYTDEHGAQRLIGRWTVYSNQQVIVNQVKYAFFLILVNAVLKTLALWFIFLYVVRRWLGRPLQQLSEFVGKLNIDNLGDKVFVLEDRGRHELHLLASKINGMAENLRNSVAKNAAMAAQLQHVMQGLEQNVAELERTGQALRESETRYRSLVDTAAEGVWMLGPDGRTIFVNARMTEILGHRSEEMIGRTVTDFMVEADFADHTQRMERRRRGVPENYEQRFIRSDGAVVWAFMSAATLFDDDHRYAGYFAMVTDITERKRAEEELHKAQAELAHVTRVTTMNVLSSSIAHEVNQPLGAIVANADAALRWLARQPPELDQTRQTLKRIMHDGQRAGEVIGRVRALLRKSETAKERIVLNDLIEDTVTLVHGEVSRHRILLRTELAPTLAPVVGDRVQLQQLLLNLVLNGIDAMKDVAGRPRELLIRSQPEEPEGWSSVSVTPGPG